MTVIGWISIRFKARISNHTHIKLWDVIAHPCPNFDGGLVSTVDTDGLVKHQAISIQNAELNHHYSSGMYE